MSANPSDAVPDGNCTQPEKSIHQVNITNSRSSRELSASAAEQDLKASKLAKEHARIRADIQVLTALAELTKESESSLRKQAALNRQTSKDQAEFEKVQEAREVLGKLITDRALKISKMMNRDILLHLQAVCHSTASRHSCTIVLRLLCEALFGDESSFLSPLAQKLLEQHEWSIRDGNLETVAVNKTTLDVATLPPTLVDGNCDKSIPHETPDLQVTEDQHEVSQHSVAVESELKVETDAVTVPHTTADLSNFGPVSSTGPRQGKSDVKPLEITDKSDSIILSKPGREQSVSIPEIEVETKRATRLSQRSTANNSSSGFFVDRDDLVGHDHSLPKKVSCSSSKQSITKTRKRRSKEIESKSDEDMASPSVLSGASTSKKQKTKTEPTNAEIVLRKFEQYISDLARNGKLSKIDFQCSKCSKEMTGERKPRKTTKCHHLYCFECAKEMKAGMNWEAYKKTFCCHVGCKSFMEGAGVIQAAGIQAAKGRFLRMGDEDDGITESDEE